jgi:ABC-2 type transport system permease protein
MGGILKLGTLFKPARKYLVIARISLANAINYRASLISGFLAYTLYIYVFMGLWRAIYQEGSVHGYTYVQIVWYLTMTELVGFFAGGNAVYRVMNDEVKSGAIAYLIGRPVHYVIYQLSNAIGQTAFNFSVFGMLAVVLGFSFVGPLPGFSLVNLPAIAISVFLGFLLHYFFMMLIGLSAFFMEDNFALYLIYSKLTFMLGTFLPVEFLPPWLSNVAKALPFSYVSWAPAKLFVSYSHSLFLELVPRQAMWTALLFGLAMFCYNAGARRLQINGG